MFLCGETEADFAVPAEVQSELYRVRPIESYDLVCLRGKFASGVTFTIAFTHSTQQWQPWQIDVYGSQGTARLAEDKSRLSRRADAVEAVLEPQRETVLGAYRQFVDFVRGVHCRPDTRLEDTRGFVLTTNGALLSSGQIHTVASSVSRRYKIGEDYGYDLPGLLGSMEHVLAEGALFSELNLPWAKRTPRVNVSALTDLPLEAFAGVPEQTVQAA
jgi:hypothetical protein